MIKVQNLTKYYSEKAAINGLNFQINKGEVVGLLGLNGSGKTTTIRILSGFLIPNEGEVWIDELNSFSDPLEIKRKVGLSNTAEYPNIKTSLLPVLNNLTAEVKNILKFHGEHSEKQVERVILCGAGSRLKNLQEFLAPQLAEAGVNKVEIGNPWQNVEGLKTVPMDASGALGFVAAIGLAMRGVDYKVY
jgi:ABC-type lipopolysaccharide export system ATPase subunit